VIKSLLLISPKTYNYHQILLEACDLAGINCTWLDERPFSSSLFKFFSRKFNKLSRRLSVRHYLTRLQKLKSSGFTPSHILVIKGESIHPSIVAYMKSAFPEAKLVLYFWDSTGNLPGWKNLSSLFDCVASFDSADCNLNGWSYYPLFCGNPAKPRNSYTPCKEKYLYDWSFVGAVHSDRLLILDKLIQNSSADNSFYAYVYFPSPLHSLYCLIVSPLQFVRLKQYFYSRPLGSGQLSAVYGQSRCVLDIHHPGQTGLTMRTIESVISGVKLATTNASVSKDLFYDNTRICIVNRRNPVILSEFLSVTFKPLPESVSNSFRPSSWLHGLLALQSHKVN
jgi:hypothetical protein